MPTLARLILIVFVLSLTFFAIALGLVAWVRPVVRELTIEVPSDDIELRPWPFSTPPSPVLEEQE